MSCFYETVLKSFLENVCGDGQTKPGGTLALPPILFGRAADHER